MKVEGGCVDLEVGGLGNWEAQARSLNRLFGSAREHRPSWVRLVPRIRRINRWTIDERAHARRNRVRVHAPVRVPTDHRSPRHLRAPAGYESEGLAGPRLLLRYGTGLGDTQALERS